MKSNELQECLKELGFEKDAIEKFAIGNKQAQLKILKEFRSEKVNAMHGVYKDLECIDYIIAQVEKS